MAQTPEGKVKDKIAALLKEFGAYKHMPVQNGMGEPALDYHVCHRGLYAAIEAKAEGKDATERQRRTMRNVIAARGSVFLIDSPTSLDFALLRGWLNEPATGVVSPAVTEALERPRAELND